MGLYLSRLFETLSGFSEGKKSRILMLGLDNAGKTTILYKVKLNDDVVTIPTLGFNVETVSPVKGVTFTVWDVGGQKALRQLWRHYYENSSGVLYVVDSADRERLQESREELQHVCQSPDMAGVPVVVLANKQDLPNACGTAEVASKLGLTDMTDRKWFVQGTCANSGQGIYEAMDQLVTLTKQFHSSRS
ncbi:uncharacterized protein LOC143285887 [Babylonia areolata]|uniref:uncharacterized protein LOC143285887 n=1 Tax=Babylonia areolata TaxID=304850 RepID=UPI003FD21DCD